MAEEKINKLNFTKFTTQVDKRLIDYFDKATAHSVPLTKDDIKTSGVVKFFRDYMMPMMSVLDNEEFGLFFKLNGFKNMEEACELQFEYRKQYGFGLCTVDNLRIIKELVGNDKYIGVNSGMGFYEKQLGIPATDSGERELFKIDIVQDLLFMFGCADYKKVIEHHKNMIPSKSVMYNRETKKIIVIESANETAGNNKDLVGIAEVIAERRNELEIKYHSKIEYLSYSEVLKKYPEQRCFFSCWPELGSCMFEEFVKNDKNLEGKILLIGEGKDGCTGTPETYEILEKAPLYKKILLDSWLTENICVILADFGAKKNNS